jgi:hypothetical protein
MALEVHRCENHFFPMAAEYKCHEKIRQNALLPKLFLLPFLTDFFVDIELKKQAFVNNHPDVTEAELEDLIEGKAEGRIENLYELVGFGRAARSRLFRLFNTQSDALHPPPPLRSSSLHDV